MRYVVTSDKTDTWVIEVAADTDRIELGNGAKLYTDKRTLLTAVDVKKVNIKDAPSLDVKELR